MVNIVAPAIPALLFRLLTVKDVTQNYLNDAKILFDAAAVDFPRVCGVGR